MAITELTLKKEISPIIERAQSFEITDPETMSEAVELLSEANAYSDRVEDERMKVMRPLLDAQKAENARWKAIKDPLAIVIATMRVKISAYQTEATRKAQEEEAKIAKRVGAGKGKLSLDSATKRMEAVDQPDTRVTTGAGHVSFKSTQILKIVDESLIPREYMLPDEKGILEALKAGKSVAGTQIEVIQTPINRR